MKMYVDELPKNCFECPCFRDDIDFPCGLSDGSKDYFLDEIDGGECPLKTLADYTKQVRKEAIGEIRYSLLDFSHGYWKVFKQNGTQYMTDDDLRECLDEILDKIGGEE